MRSIPPPAPGTDGAAELSCEQQFWVFRRVYLRSQHVLFHPEARPVSYVSRTGRHLLLRTGLLTRKARIFTKGRQMDIPSVSSYLKADLGRASGTRPSGSTEQQPKPRARSRDATWREGQCGSDPNPTAAGPRPSVANMHRAWIHVSRGWPSLAAVSRQGVCRAHTL